MALASPPPVPPKFLLYSFIIIGIIPKLLSLIFRTLHLPDYTGLDSDYLRLSRNPAYNRQTPNLFRKALPPVVKFQDLIISDGCTATSCIVCLCEFDQEDEIRPLIECNHVFHGSCLDRWMNHFKFTCPLCRTPLVRYDKLEEIKRRQREDEVLDVLRHN